MEPLTKVVSDLNKVTADNDIALAKRMKQMVWMMREQHERLVLVEKQLQELRHER